MTGLKCPFCHKRLQNDDLLCSCINEHCEESFDMVGTELLWQKVIDLKQEIDRTRKALDVAKYAIKNIKDDMKKVKDGDDIWETQKNLHDYCKTTIKKITALEQKDK